MDNRSELHKSINKAVNSCIEKLPYTMCRIDKQVKFSLREGKFSIRLEGDLSAPYYEEGKIVTWGDLDEWRVKNITCLN